MNRDVTRHEDFMRTAIAEAEKALREGNFPYGAVLVKNDKVVAKAHNRVLTDKDPTAHSEINVIRKLAKKRSDVNLQGHILYTTFEPCPMCAGACIWSGVSKIAYGLSLKDVEKLGENHIKIRCEDIANAAFKKIEIISGILKDECLELYIRAQKENRISEASLLEEK